MIKTSVTFAYGNLGRVFTLYASVSLLKSKHNNRVIDKLEHV